MPPLHLYTTSALDAEMNISFRKDNDLRNGAKPEAEKLPPNQNHKYKWEIVWRNVIGFMILHALAFYGIYLIVFENKWALFFYAYLYGLIVAQGITAGAHRLWSHRSYKAKLPLRIILLFLQTSAFQNSAYVWIRDHRLHHKYTDTDADPHNAKRGFFFSHMGWLMIRKHQDVKDKGKCIDMSDISSDPLLMWQHRHYLPLMVICCFIIPTVIPYYFWNESFWTSFLISGIFRYVYSVHSTWLVNSAAHIFGMKPFDKSIGPAENMFVALMAVGEGFHNYHHVFPWDYKTSELGNLGPNWTLAIINLFAKIGWAYDLKTVSQEVIRKRAMRTGDGSWGEGNCISKEGSVVDQTGSVEEGAGEIWGWGDADMKQEDINSVEIINRID